MILIIALPYKVLKLDCEMVLVLLYKSVAKSHRLRYTFLLKPPTYQSLQAKLLLKKNKSIGDIYGWSILAVRYIST